MTRALILGAAALVLSAAAHRPRFIRLRITATQNRSLIWRHLWVRSSGSPTGVHGTACLCSPGLYSTANLRGAGSCLRSSIGVPLLRSARGFAANICLRAKVLGWLRAWVARLRPQVWVALKTRTVDLLAHCGNAGTTERGPTICGVRLDPFRPPFL